MLDCKATDNVFNLRWLFSASHTYLRYLLATLMAHYAYSYRTVHYAWTPNGGANMDEFKSASHPVFKTKIRSFCTQETSVVHLGAVLAHIRKHCT